VNNAQDDVAGILNLCPPSSGIYVVAAFHSRDLQSTSDKCFSGVTTADAPIVRYVVSFAQFAIIPKLLNCSICDATWPFAYFSASSRIVRDDA
jgi:hypothetical protein